jgi:hypothetical protein
VKSLNDVTLTSTDSFLLLGKAKDLKAVQTTHLGSVLSNLEIPENVSELALFSDLDLFLIKLNSF